MTLVASAPHWLATILLLLLVAAAIEDMWRMQINDWVCGAVAAGAFLAVAIDGPAGQLWQNLLLFALVLGFGTLLFVRGWMGGGDIKLLAASSLWFNLDLGWKMLAAVAIAGGLETILVAIIRSFPWPRSARDRIMLLRREEAIPYGLAIAAGVAFVGVLVR